MTTDSATPVNATGTEDAVPPLLLAAQRGDAAQVAMLLDAGADIAAIGAHRNSVLHEAVGSGDLATVQLLIARGANLEARNRAALRPLHWAAQTGALPLVQALVEAGAKLDPKGSMSFVIMETPTPLYQAVSEGHREVARYLLERGAHNDIACDSSHGTPLTQACRRDDLALVELLLAHGASPNGLSRGERPDYFYFPLGNARSADVVERLVAAGADVRARNCYGQTALHWLADHSPVEIGPEATARVVAAIAALLRHGADPSARDMHGHTPALRARAAEISRALAGGGKPADLGRLLAEAVRDLGRPERMDLLESLLAHATAGVSDAPDDRYEAHYEQLLLRVIDAMGSRYREVPLARHVAVIERLLALGAAADWDGRPAGDNALHQLARVTLEPVADEDVPVLLATARRLIEAGAVLDAIDGEGCRPLDLAAHPALFRDLRNRGAAFGRAHVALFAAMEGVTRHGQDLARVDELLAAGAPLEARSPMGDTPFLFAARMDSPLLLEAMLARGADLTARGAEGASALHIACAAEAWQAAAWLIGRGASLEAKDASARTPLERVATKKQRVALAKLAGPARAARRSTA